MDSFKSFFLRLAAAVKSFCTDKVMPSVKKAASATAEFSTDKALPWLKSAGEKIVAFFRKPVNAIAVGAGAAVIVAACVLLWFHVNVWSWVDNVTLLLPPDVYAASMGLVSDSDTVSDGDLILSGSDAVSAGDVVSASDEVSAADADTAVSGTDVSGSDVSGSDVQTNEAEEPVPVVLRMKKGSTVADALSEANVTLDESLSVDVPLDTLLVSDMVISVYRMKFVTVTADGTDTGLYTEAQTVGELLEECGIVLNEPDRISCPTDAPVTNDMTVTINRVVVVDEVRAEPIPFSTERRENANVKAGETSVITAGVDGSKDVTYRCTYVDGVLESSEIVGEVVTLEPVTEIIEVGTKRTTTTRRTNPGRYVISKEAVYDCDGSGHGYYIITYSDGTVEYRDF